MDDLRLVDRGEAIARLGEQAAQFLAPRWIRAKPLIERASLQEFHHQVGPAIGRGQLSVRKNLDDVSCACADGRWLRPRHESVACLLETRPGLSGAGWFAAQDLHGHSRPRARYGLVHRSHSAGFQKSGDGPQSNLSSDGKGVLTLGRRGIDPGGKRALGRARPGGTA